MKKTCTWILCVLLASFLIACSSSSSKPESTSSDTAKEKTEEKKEEKVSVKDFSQVIVENENIKFEITGIEPDGIMSYDWKVYLENNTDKTLMYAIEDASINGTVCTPVFATTVAPGKKSNDTVSWLKSLLKDSHIEDVTAVEFHLRVYDSDDWSADALVDEVFTVYPMGEENAEYVVFEQKDSDQVLFDNEYCRMIVTGSEEGSIYGYNMKVYLENKTDHTMMFAVDESSINGFMCEPFWATSIPAHKNKYDSIGWLKSSLDENGITDIESVEIRVRVYDFEDFSAGSYVDDYFTVNP